MGHVWNGGDVGPVRGINDGFAVFASGLLWGVKKSRVWKIVYCNLFTFILKFYIGDVWKINCASQFFVDPN